jgi:histidine triad (HIT) family protein
MPLTDSQIQELKSQLKSQVQNLPAQQREEALAQIDSMSSEALEEMLEQQRSQNTYQKTIYRMIIDKEVDSIIVGENSTSLAVLEINPISQGHILIIPKSPKSAAKEITKTTFQLAESLSKKITENLKAKSVRLETQVNFGEAIINLIPSYDNKVLDINSPRQKATPEDLEKIKKSLETIQIKPKTKKQIVKKPKPQKQEYKLKSRIP